LAASCQDWNRIFHVIFLESSRVSPKIKLTTGNRTDHAHREPMIDSGVALER